MSEQTNLAELYMHHWALDSQAAGRLAEAAVGTALERVTLEVVQGLGAAAVAIRDAHRETLGGIYTLQSPKKVQTYGACSGEAGVDYTPIWDWIVETQAEITDSLLDYRSNLVKPRSGVGWTGPLNSVDASEREGALEISRAAFNRGIPVVTEVTHSSQLFEQAPYLSGFWLGARDMKSTALRTGAAAYHLPVQIKNGQDGSVDDVKRAIATVRSNTKDNEGSGFDFGLVDGRKLILPVGEGNKQVAIIARGYPVPLEMSAKSRAKKAIQHLSEMCVLGAEQGCAVVLDLSHDVPEMFDIRRENPDRVLFVLKKFHKAIAKEGRIKHSEVLKGILAEVGVDEGRTDRNFVLDENSKGELTKLAHKTDKLLTP